MPPRVATGCDVQCLATARVRARVRQKSTDRQSPLPRCGPNNLTVELGQASSDRLERLEAVLDGIAAILIRVQEQQDVTTATLTELRDFVVTQRTIKTGIHLLRSPRSWAKNHTRSASGAVCNESKPGNAPQAVVMRTSGKSLMMSWNVSRTMVYSPFPPNTESIACCCWSG